MEEKIYSAGTRIYSCFILLFMGFDFIQMTWRNEETAAIKCTADGDEVQNHKSKMHGNLEKKLQKRNHRQTKLSEQPAVILIGQGLHGLTPWRKFSHETWRFELLS